MSFVPPTKWLEVPGAVREALADPFIFTKKGEDGAPAQGMPILRHLADLAGWNASGPISNSFGGPTPLSSTIIGAGLGSLGGYGVGRLADQLLPAKYFEPGALRRRAAIMGAALGAAPGLWQASDNVRAADGDPSAVLDTWPPKAAEKVAADLFAPMIDRDRFNQQVLDFDGTPMPIRAATAGLVEAASSVSGSNWVSPWDVAKIAVGAGAGLTSGIIAGKALGLLAGLNEAGQSGVMRTGLWTGLLSAVVPRALGLR